MNVYDPDGNDVDVSGFKIDIKFLIGRLEYKNEAAVNFEGNLEYCIMFN